MKNGFALKVRHFRLLWVGWQKLAARQLREARGLEKSFYAWIKPATPQMPATRWSRPGKSWGSGRGDF